MPIKILMPALSPTMTQGNLTKWSKKEGEVVKAGQVLAEIETDKATMEVEAVDEGILAKILVKEGTENVAVNSVIAILLEEGEDLGQVEKVLQELNGPVSSIEMSTNLPHNDRESITPSQNNAKEITDNISAGQEKNPVMQSERIFASPLAKRIAKDKGINLAGIVGTGPHGRIIKVDIENIKENLASSNLALGQIIRNTKEYTEVPNSNIRKIIAKRLLEAKQTIPHFYLSIECNVDKLLETRADINLNIAIKENKISVNDFIILASAKSLKEIKEVNASWDVDAIKYYNNVDISVAVATDYGLITPIIRNTEQKNIIVLSNEMKELARKAKANKLIPEEFQGGGFTISNLGMFGIKNFSAIINPPQSCILAIGASNKMPIIFNEQIKIATIMNVTLSCDHRVVDGVVGAKFLASFKKYIEHPALMLV